MHLGFLPHGVYYNKQFYLKAAFITHLVDGQFGQSS